MMKHFKKFTELKIKETLVKTKKEMLRELKDKETILTYSPADTFTELEAKNKELFQIYKEIEKLEHPEAYARNKDYWEQS